MGNWGFPGAHRHRHWGWLPWAGRRRAEDTVRAAWVNLAARLESAAPPGGLLISDDTYRHVRGVFNVEPLEPIQAKGFAESVPLHRCRGLSRAPSGRRRVVWRGVETRHGGREVELKYLQDARLTVVEGGEGQVVTVGGEAGRGQVRACCTSSRTGSNCSHRTAVRFEGVAARKRRDCPTASLA